MGACARQLRCEQHREQQSYYYYHAVFQHNSTCRHAGWLFPSAPSRSQCVWLDTTTLDTGAVASLAGCDAYNSLTRSLILRVLSGFCLLL